METLGFLEREGNVKVHQLVSIMDLQVGDIIRGRASGQIYVVSNTYGDRATAVRSQDVTNPSEWEVIEAKYSTKRIYEGSQ